MKSQYEKDCYDLLQIFRDKEDENAQKARKAEKAKTCQNHANQGWDVADGLRTGSPLLTFQ